VAADGVTQRTAAHRERRAGRAVPHQRDPGSEHRVEQLRDHQRGAASTINTRAATWATNANSKAYGDNDPGPLTTGTGTNFVRLMDNRDVQPRPGETVLGGPYHIMQRCPVGC